MKFIHPNVFNWDVQERWSDAAIVVSGFVCKLSVFIKSPFVLLTPVVVVWLGSIPTVEIQICLTWVLVRMFSLLVTNIVQVFRPQFLKEDNYCSLVITRWVKLQGYLVAFYLDLTFLNQLINFTKQFLTRDFHNFVVFTARHNSHYMITCGIYTMQIFIYTDIFLFHEFLHSLTLNQQLPFDDITLSPSDNNAKDITMKFAIQIFSPVVSQDHQLQPMKMDKNLPLLWMNNNLFHN